MAIKRCIGAGCVKNAAPGRRECAACYHRRHRQGSVVTVRESTDAAPIEVTVTHDDVFRAVKAASPRGGLTIQELATRFDIEPSTTWNLIAGLQIDGKAIRQFGNKWLVDTPAAGETFGRPLISDKDGWHKFGAIGDTHMGSKHERLDELKDFYRIVEANNISTVLHTGNYIDGESRFNRHELKVHGMDAQLAHMGSEYPQVAGVDTYMVSGDDHEGWYAQREGVDIGFYMESVMKRGGRTDIHNLGYMECFLPLRHGQTGAQQMVHVVHPGGGSAYAVSYTMQKQIEAYEGGEKPAIVLAGHYHKAEHLEMRNVHGFQTGCFQDQTTFMRKKKLIATIGGWIIFARQDPETGAISEVFSYFKGYYNRGFHVNNRWSLSGPVSLVPRIKLV